MQDAGMEIVEDGTKTSLLHSGMLNRSITDQPREVHVQLGFEHHRGCR